MLMNKPRRIILLFVLIFLVGVLSFVARINNSLEKSHSIPVSKQTDTLSDQG